MSSDYAIEAEGLVTSYGDVKAPAGVDLRAPAGSVVGRLYHLGKRRHAPLAASKYRKATNR